MKELVGLKRGVTHFLQAGFVGFSGFVFTVIFGLLFSFLFGYTCGSSVFREVSFIVSGLVGLTTACFFIWYAFGKKAFVYATIIIVGFVFVWYSANVFARSRDKGSDAAIKANIANLRAESELFYDREGSYAGVCQSEYVTEVGVAVAVAQKNPPRVSHCKGFVWRVIEDLFFDKSEEKDIPLGLECREKGDAYIMYSWIHYKEDDKQQWRCIDSEGAAVQVDMEPTDDQYLCKP
jgi:hypothetical protein